MNCSIPVTPSMKKIYLLIAACFCSYNLSAQTFGNNSGGFIEEVGIENLFPVEVAGLTNSIDSVSFGLVSVCFNIIHTYDADLDIRLKSPDGTIITLSNNNGSSLDNFIATCVNENALNGEIGEGNAPFTGSFYPDQSINKMNNGQNPNGTWNLILIDEAPADTGYLANATITFGTNPPPTHVGGPCTITNAFGCECQDGTDDCDLLPNMVNSELYIQEAWTEYDGYLRLGVATPNIGWGPLEMHGTGNCYCDSVLVNCNAECPDGSYPMENVVQTIYHKSGPTMTTYSVSAGTMTYHAQHGHIHIDNWTYNTLRIRGLDPDPTTWPIIGAGTKISFCLINLGTCTSGDSYCSDENGNIYDIGTMHNGGLGNVSGCGEEQGIYGGKYDAYDQYLDGQTIDFGDVCDGQYYIVSQTDPLNEVVEANDSDNYAAVLIDLISQQAGGCCAAHFTADTTYGIAPFQVQFIDSTVPVANGWMWDFGDGSTSTDQFPQHVYTMPGIYTVKLLVNTSSGCIDTIVHEEFITVDFGTGSALFLDRAEIQLSAFPNPVTGTSNIQFILDRPSNLQLTVTDVTGRTMKTLFDGVHPSGEHLFTIDMNKEGWTNGIYFIHAKTGNNNFYVKLVKM